MAPTPSPSTILPPSLTIDPNRPPSTSIDPVRPPSPSSDPNRPPSTPIDPVRPETTPATSLPVHPTPTKNAIYQRNYKQSKKDEMNALRESDDPRDIKTVEEMVK